MCLWRGLHVASNSHIIYVFSFILLLVSRFLYSLHYRLVVMNSQFQFVFLRFLSLFPRSAVCWSVGIAGIQTAEDLTCEINYYFFFCVGLANLGRVCVFHWEDFFLFSSKVFSFERRNKAKLAINSIRFTSFVALEQEWDGSINFPSLLIPRINFLFFFFLYFFLTQTVIFLCRV